MTYLVAFILIIIGADLHAQEVGQWKVGLNIDYSQPVGGLSDWFKADPGYSVSAGNQYNDHWFLEGMIEYSKYDKENTGGYIDERVDLLLEHVGFLVNGKYDVLHIEPVTIFFNIGAGIFNWKGMRGEVKADSTITPFIPRIDSKTLKETNWGLRSGMGISYQPLSSLSIELSAYYRFIVGDLWPTLQPHIELEGVSGFQTINFSLGIRYHL